ncbi:MAG: hypothetical protein PHX93_05900 [Candidatus Peribacteraceae bacterium]|jgi:hypothetical protein|nr:hypothetical protein [Candidatus Peribacteraceae bacterium]
MECRICEAGYVQGRGQHLCSFLSHQSEVIASTISVVQEETARVTTFEVNATHRSQLEHLAGALRQRFGMVLQVKVPPEQMDPLESLQATNVFG